MSTSSADLTQMVLSEGQRAAIVAEPTRIRTFRTSDGASLRVSAQVTDVPAGSLIVVTGLSTGDVSRTLHQLFLLELAIGGGAIVVALLITASGVRLGLRPLRRVTRTAQEVATELSPEGAGLDRRVPVSRLETDSEAGHLARAMNTLLGAVEAQFEARIRSEARLRQFLADASHELRTPLTSIRGYAEFARLSRGAGDAEGVADMLSRIESEGTRMSRLVEDLLMLARSDHGALPQRADVDVRELVDEAVQSVQAAHTDRPIEIAVQADLTLSGDPDQLLRALRNLITNAAIHTAPRGMIRVSSYVETDEIVLRVDDSGPGLPVEEAEHIFERFWRSDQSRTRTRGGGGGTGLGMAIVASVVHAHGGTVRFDSSLESGSTVTIRLPIA